MSTIINGGNDIKIKKPPAQKYHQGSVLIWVHCQLFLQMQYFTNKIRHSQISNLGQEYTVTWVALNTTKVLQVTW